MKKGTLVAVVLAVVVVAIGVTCGFTNVCTPTPSVQKNNP